MAAGSPPAHRHSTQQEERSSPLLDKLLPRKPLIMETLFAKLKSDMGLEHSRHRSSINTFVHLLSGAYSPA